MRNRPCTTALAPRPGFTLIELLVAITIFVVLATLVVGAYRGVSDEDRLRNATQQIKSMVNGAKSRALKDKLPRGIRFLADPNDSNVIESMVYVGALPNFRKVAGESIQGSNGGFRIEIESATASDSYAELKAYFDNGQLNQAAIRANGLRIRIGEQWYRMNSSNVDATRVQLVLSEPYRAYNSSSPQISTDYEIELGAVVLGEDPVPLPQNVGISLSHSFTSGSFTVPRDLMFGPSGTPIGPKSQILLRLLLADRRDIDSGSLDSGAQPKYEQRVLTFVGSTGQTYASNAGSRPNFLRYAEKGQEAKQ